MTAETAAPLVANRYRLDEVIGSGAVGRVWRGEDTVLRRAVAVKEVPLPQHLMDDEREALRARVMREAQAAARIHHPGSVQVFDVVDEAERVYLVMELVDELTLADVVATHGPLTPEATAAVGVELLGALEAAHRVGIVHRDVKPRNVMVLPNGGVKLADFGIASLRDDPRLTKTGMVLGTPSYMAPEQALGEEAGPASDLWGTGALLYYAVEGEPPFDRGEPIATLHAVVTGDPRPSARAGALAPVLTDLLAKDPTERLALPEAKARLASIAAGSAEDNERTVAMAAAATRAAPRPDATTVADRTTVDPVADPPRQPERPAPATVATAPSSYPSRRDDGDRRVPLAALAAILGVLALGAFLLLRGGDGDDGTETEADDGGVAAVTTTTAPGTTSAAPPSSSPSAGPVADSTTTTTAEEDDGTTTTTASPTTTAPPTAGDRPAGVPATWVPYTAPVGWSIWHPPGWQPAPGAGRAVNVTDPATGDYLRVDSVAQAGDDAVAAWRRSSASFAGRYPDYRELRIEETTYQGYEAALWEYTYQGQHATNLGIVTPGPGYALNFQTAESRWAERQDLREAFEAGFTIPD